MAATRMAATRMAATRRLVCLGLVLSCLLSGVVIVVFFGRNSFVRGVLGDVIVVVLMYFVLKAGRDFRPLNLALFVFSVAFLVEIGQYFGVIELLGMRETYVTRIVFGSAFDYADILAYATGAAIAFLVDTKILSRIKVK